jgi:hypothetical protein
MDLTPRPVWPASDLARRRIEIMDEARHGVAFIRSSDGTLLAFTAAAALSGLDQTQRHRRLLSAAITALVDADARPSALGELAFVVDWSAPRRRQFAEDLNDVINHASSTGNPAEVDTFLELSMPRQLMGVVDPERIRSAIGALA